MKKTDSLPVPQIEKKEQRTGELRKGKRGEVESFLLLNVSFLRETLKTKFKRHAGSIFMGIYSLYMVLGFIKTFSLKYMMCFEPFPNRPLHIPHYPSPVSLLHFPGQYYLYFLVIYTNKILGIYRNLEATNERKFQYSCF